MKVSNAIASIVIGVFFLAWMVASYQNYSQANQEMAFNIAAFIVSAFDTFRIIAVTPINTNLGVVAIFTMMCLLIDRNRESIGKRVDRMFKR